MHTSTILTTALLLAVNALAQDDSNDDSAAVTTVTYAAATSFIDPYSKYESAISALATENAAEATGVVNWESTQTAFPSSAIATMDDDFINGHYSGSTPPVPDYFTALPSSLQAFATSYYDAVADIIRTDYLPAASAFASASASAFGTDSAQASASASASASSQVTSSVVSSATHKATSSQASSASSKASSGSGPSSASSAPTAKQTGSGAGKNEVVMAAGLLGLSLTGIMAFL